MHHLNTVYVINIVRKDALASCFNIWYLLIFVLIAHSTSFVFLTGVIMKQYPAIYQQKQKQSLTDRLLYFMMVNWKRTKRYQLWLGLIWATDNVFLVPKTATHVFFFFCIALFNISHIEAWTRWPAFTADLFKYITWIITLHPVQPNTRQSLAENWQYLRILQTY